MNPWSAMEKWWTTIADMSFPINIKDGNFTFVADGMHKVVTFSGTYPKQLFTAIPREYPNHDRHSSVRALAVQFVIDFGRLTGYTKTVIAC